VSTSTDRLHQASLDGIGMVQATKTRLEGEAQEMLHLRDHLIWLELRDGGSARDIAEACGLTVQAVYLARDAAIRRQP
jgi:hypothetical protein